MTERDDELVIDLKLLFQVLMSKIWTIIAAGLAGGVVALLITFFLIAPKYEANLLMYVNNSSSQGTSSVVNSSELTTAQKLVATYLVILESRTTLDEVVAETGVEYTHEELKKMITAQAVNSTEVFEVVVTSTDPAEAVALADAIANVLPDKIAAVVNGSSVRIVDAAIAPEDPVSPSKAKNTIIGGMLGAILAAAVIVLKELFNESITSEDYIMSTYPDIPLLAVIPDAATHKTGYYGRRRDPGAGRKIPVNRVAGGEE